VCHDTGFKARLSGARVVIVPVIFRLDILYRKHFTPIFSVGGTAGKIPS
jgi:hypothetical protein